MTEHEPRPRLDPVPVDGYHRLARELWGEEVPPEVRPRNLARTWALNPRLMAAQRPYQRHLRSTSTLHARHQEMAVLRIGWRVPPHP